VADQVHPLLKLALIVAVPDVKASADEALAAALKLIQDRAPHQ